MRWKGGRKSSNVEDRRGQSTGYSSAGGSGVLSLLPMLIRTKTGRSILVIGLVVFFGAKMLGIDLAPLFFGSSGTTVSIEPREIHFS